MSAPSKHVAMGAADAPLPEACDVAIIGGGIIGLAIAYELSRRARLRVVVLERSYLVAGASGRNGGGVRMQWGDEGNVRLMQESIATCRGLAQELGINTWFRQGGYLFLARSDAAVARLERNAEIHARVGARTRLLSPREALDVVPQLDISGVRACAFNPDDGVVFPWSFVWGYAAQAAKRGVVIRTHTRVDGLEPAALGYVLQLSTGERLRAARVVNATGAWSHGLNRALGVELPNHPHRHEILSCEPLKPFLDPLVVDLATGLYVSQSTRGELVAGITLPDPEGAAPRDDVHLGSTLRFLARISRALIRVLPLTAQLRPLRQWSGPYDVSPDGDAIVGPTPGHPNLIQVCGFTGHGFMMAPVVGRIVADFLATGAAHAMLDRWRPSRFAEGALERREDMIIG
jgi:sarcosine oxidase subunit beta